MGGKYVIDAVTRGRPVVIKVKVMSRSSVSLRSTEATGFLRSVISALLVNLNLQ